MTRRQYDAPNTFDAALLDAGIGNMPMAPIAAMSDTSSAPHPSSARPARYVPGVGNAHRTTVTVLVNPITNRQNVNNVSPPTQSQIRTGSMLLCTWGGGGPRTLLPLRSARRHGRGGVHWSGATFEKFAEKTRHVGKKLCGQFLAAARISPGRITVLYVNHVLEPGRVVCVCRRISAVGCHFGSSCGCQWVSNPRFYDLCLRCHLVRFYMRCLQCAGVEHTSFAWRCPQTS